MAEEDAISALLATGFKQSSTNDTEVTLLPCPLGSFFDVSGIHKCCECPPGILHVSYSLANRDKQLNIWYI